MLSPLKEGQTMVRLLTDFPHVSELQLRRVIRFLDAPAVAATPVGPPLTMEMSVTGARGPLRSVVGRCASAPPICEPPQRVAVGISLFSMAAGGIRGESLSDFLRGASCRIALRTCAALNTPSRSWR